MKALRFIEQRINATIEIWGVDDIAFKVGDIASKMRSFAEQVRDGAGLLHGPRHEDGLKQGRCRPMLREARSQAFPAASAHQSEAGALPAAPAEPGSGFQRPEPLSLPNSTSSNAPPLG